MMPPAVSVCYFHGFGSSPESKKGQLIGRALDELQITDGLQSVYYRPNLNGADITQLTMHTWHQRALDAVAGCDPSVPLLLCGSSLGAYTAAMIAREQLQRFPAYAYVLLAPAFNFMNNWQAVVGVDGVQHWREQGCMPFSYRGNDGATCEGMLPYAFYESCAHAPAFPPAQVSQSQRAMSIIHGRDDNICAAADIESYATEHPHVDVEILEDDHALLSAHACQRIQQCIGTTLRKLLPQSHL